MRMHYSDTGVFDNSHTRYRLPTLLVGHWIEGQFDNGIAHRKKNPQVSAYRGIGLFDNSVPQIRLNKSPIIGWGSDIAWYDNGVISKKHLLPVLISSLVDEFNNSVSKENRTETPVIGMYSSTAWYDNGVKSLKIKQLMQCFSSVRWFDNSQDPSNGGDKPEVTVGPCSVISEFNNAYSGGHPYQIGNWSLGVFDLANNISLLQYEEYGIEEIKADLVWPDLTYNWFDNSVPVVGRAAQYKLIPWGYKTRDIQFSINFPEYPLEMQVSVPTLGKGEQLATQWFATPPHDTDEKLEYQWSAETDKWRLEFQVRPGEATRKAVELQYETLKEMVSFNQYQYSTYWTGNEELEVQYNRVYKIDETIEQQVDVITNSDEKLEIQMRPSLPASSAVEFQMESLKDRIELIQLQWKTAVDIQEALEIQSKMSYTVADVQEIQYGGYTAIEDGLEMQFDKNYSSAYPELEMQLYATPPIDGDDRLETQYKVEYTTEDVLEQQWDIDRFITDAKVEYQWLQSAKADKTIEWQYETVIEAKIRAQAKIIPLGYDLLKGQAKLLATMRSGLGVQFNTTVEKDYPLELQSMVEVEMDSKLEQQWFTSIVKDYPLEVQINPAEISKEYAQEVQYVLSERIEEPLEQQVNTVILMDSLQELQVDTTVAKNYPLEIQIDVPSIWKDEWLDVQYNIEYITKDEVLDMQYDILDLVYYMLYNGYNLVPWWSDGKGHWDQSIDKDWDKDDTSNTMADNLVQQLNDLELDVEVGEMIDVGTRNFMYYRELLNTDLNNKVLKLLHKDTDKKYLTLGKSKKEKTSTIEFKEGDNVFFYDGAEEMFNAAVRDQISDKLQHTLVWKPQTGEWEKFTDDVPVYFYEEVNGKEMAMPYVFIGNVLEDCEIEVTR